MSFEYKYFDKEGDALTIMPSIDSRLVFVGIGKETITDAVHIAKTDVPTVALELLKAAGHTDLAGYVASTNAAREAAEKAEAEAAEKKRQERRDALAKEFTNGVCYYASTVFGTKAAIDRIIELEDGASRD